MPVLQRGEVQTAIGTGFLPGEVVAGVMNSTPTIQLGTQVADADGEVTFVWTIPQSAALSTHTVTLTGEESGSVSGPSKWWRSRCPHRFGPVAGDGNRRAAAARRSARLWRLAIAVRQQAER
ncbi:hypothetical protein KAE78_04205 [Microbacterium sp. NIBRBAC000506063]|nr:hypothetical protein KAE78_04205 [Microbacterium sp. NIBRBAC000506063]